MALSGKYGTVYKNGVALVTEVIRWEATPTGFKREYGHDKSGGWQDVCYGTKRLEGTIEVKCRADGVDFGACNFYELDLYPLGSENGTPMNGYAGIDATPLVVNVENGEPISATYRWSSKGPWTGLPNDGQEWGGFEGNEFDLNEQS